MRSHHPLQRHARARPRQLALLARPPWNVRWPRLRPAMTPGCSDVHAIGTSLLAAGRLFVTVATCFRWAMEPIFISYSSKHRESTRALAAAIEAQYGAGSAWGTPTRKPGILFDADQGRAGRRARGRRGLDGRRMVSDYVYAEAVRALEAASSSMYGRWTCSSGTSRSRSTSIISMTRRSMGDPPPSPR